MELFSENVRLPFPLCGTGSQSSAYLYYLTIHLHSILQNNLILAVFIWAHDLATATTHLNSTNAFNFSSGIDEVEDKSSVMHESKGFPISISSCLYSPSCPLSSMLEVCSFSTCPLMTLMANSKVSSSPYLVFLPKFICDIWYLGQACPSAWDGTATSALTSPELVFDRWWTVFNFLAFGSISVITYYRVTLGSSTFLFFFPKVNSSHCGISSSLSSWCDNISIVITRTSACSSTSACPGS